jgi:hypothetical protein
MKNLKFKIKKFKIVLDSGRLCLDTRGASIYVRLGRDRDQDMEMLHDHVLDAFWDYRNKVDYW